MKPPEPILEIQGKKIGPHYPNYFIADIAANHDGDLERAKTLIYLAAEAGAEEAKFQHFKAETIVSDHGFRNLSGQQSHQAKWKKSVFEVYRDASVSLDWTGTLKETCDKAGIAFFTSPLCGRSRGSHRSLRAGLQDWFGDITWIEMISISPQSKNPMSWQQVLPRWRMSTCGLCRAGDKSMLCLMQCNTNYTASLEFQIHQLNVLKTYRAMYPELVLGLSDHTRGHATVLRAVALGSPDDRKALLNNISRVGRTTHSQYPRTGGNGGSGLGN